MRATAYSNYFNLLSAIAPNNLAILEQMENEYCISHNKYSNTSKILEGVSNQIKGISIQLFSMHVLIS